MRVRRAAAVFLAVASACRRAPASAAAVVAPKPPKGDVLWLSDPAAAADAALDAQAEKIGAAAVFLAAGTLGAQPGPGAFEAVAPPPKPLTHVPVVLVVAPSAALAAALASGEGPSAAPLGAAGAAALAAAIRDGAFGRVIGVHLDFPFGPKAAARYAELVGALRKGLPAGVFVSVSLKALPASEDDRKKETPLYAAADALVAVVFGVGPRVDPIATDALRRPWWAAYDTRAVGVFTGPGGEPRGDVPERLAEPLSGNARFQFENDLSVNDGSVWAFTLTARAPVRLEGLAFESGDRVNFRLPAVSEMLFQLGSNLAGKRFALGRALVFGGATEADRLFDLEAMEDVLLGRALAPRLETSVRPAGRNAVAVDLANRSAHASVASRVDNWVEVDVAPAHPADVQVGGFDRYEVFDRAGKAVTPGRATVVRFYETLIAPFEIVTPARVVVRGNLPAACCRYRVHAMAAAGPEVTEDWVEPPAPTPKPRPEAKRPPTRKRG